ncbi:MAG: hypothetical protein ACE5PO_05145, partial [Candidatus Bathyarchaeia archaeon]
YGYATYNKYQKKQAPSDYWLHHRAWVPHSPMRMFPPGPSPILSRFRAGVIIYLRCNKLIAGDIVSWLRFW